MPPRPGATAAPRQGATAPPLPPPPFSRRRLGLIAGFGAAVVIAVVVVAVAAGSQHPEATATPSTSAQPSPSAAETTASPTPAPTPTATPVPVPDSAAVALAQLAAMEVVSGYSDARYDRALFGQAWADVDRNGCDTRNDILGRDLLEPVFKAGTRDCKVLAGTLIDPYDGLRTEFISGQNTSVLVQIDHIVALAWAWRHGAEFWTDDQRLFFANDPLNLQASSEQTNQEKSDSGPSEWLPPAAERRCDFVERFVGVLDAYDLGINPADKAASQAVLERC